MTLAPDDDITVVIAAFQAEHFIDAAVRSALAQDPPPAEVIVVDDHSGDATATVAAAAGARVIRQATNAGPGVARAAGVAAATTRWIAWLDADDIYLPGHLARLLGASAGHVLVADTAIGSRTGRWCGWAGLRPRVLRSPTQLLPENPIVLSSSMARRDALEAIGGFALGRYSEDLRTWILLLEAGTGIIVPTVGAVYGEHENQATGKPEMVASAEAVYAEFADRGWFHPRQVAALRVAREWDSDRRGAVLDMRAWPALLSFLINRRRIALRHGQPPPPRGGPATSGVA